MKQYLELLQDIIDNGVVKTDRTGVGTKSVFGRSLRFDLSKGLPLVTTRKMFWSTIVSEILWFMDKDHLLDDDTLDERRLAEIKYNLPREQLIDKTTIWTLNAEHQGKEKGFVNNDLVKGLGRVYGAQYLKAKGVGKNNEIKTVNQFDYVINELKTNPSSRRIMINGWNVCELDQMALPPCVFNYIFNVIDGKLNCMVTCRSNDYYIGNPTNIVQSALITHMIAQCCDLDVGELVYNIADCHLYLNHIDAALEQLSRTPYPSPKLWLNPSIKNIYDFTMDDIKLIDYQCHPAIKVEMAV